MSAPLTPIAARISFRPMGAAGWFRLDCAFHRNMEDARELVADWNRRDRGVREWRCMECLPEDFDYPRV